MTDIHTSKDEWGQYVIYVNKCEKYEYEEQIDTYDLHNIENRRIYDIILREENYSNL